MRLNLSKYLKPLDSRGVANYVFALATTAIALMVVAMFAGKMQTTGTSALSSSTAALAAFNNVTDFTWSGVTIAALGMIVLGGIGILSYFSVGFGGRGRGGRRR